MPVDLPKAGETKDEYLAYCIPQEINSGKEQDVAAAICYSYWDKDKMSKITDTTNKVMARVAYDTKYKGINLFAEAGEDPCTTGYKQLGMKDLDGTMVPNCIPEESHPDNK
jgi:hypothetical protein